MILDQQPQPGELTIADRLKRLRWEKHLRRSDVAKATKIDESTIGCYERGANYPTYWNFLELAKFYNVSLDYLGGFHPRRPLYEAAKHQDNDRTPTSPYVLGSGSGLRRP